MADTTFSEHGFDEQRAFEARVVQMAWYSRTQSDELDLRFCGVAGPGFERHFELGWARDGRMRRGTQFVMDPANADATVEGVRLARRALAQDYLWEDIGSAPSLDAETVEAVEWQATLLEAVAQAGRTVVARTPLRRVALSRAYRDTALVVEWAGYGDRLNRMALDVPPPPGPGDDHAAHAQDYAMDFLLHLDEGASTAIDVGPA